MKHIRVAVAGAGNCAASFSQFVAVAQSHPEAELPGLMCPTVGGYRLSDISIVLAFDVDDTKVGKPLAEAFRSAQISATQFADLGADSASPVIASPLLDGLDGPLSELVRVAPEVSHCTEADVAKALADAEVGVLVISLPTGSTQAVRMFVRASLAAGVSIVNATPESLARDASIAASYTASGLAVLGDDLRSHLGATTLHTALLELFASRGLKTKHSYQLNVGGNTDFLNLASPDRSISKYESKSNALRAAGYLGDDTGAGPTGYVGHLGDRKLCFLNVTAESVLGSEVSVDVQLRVEDSPNAAGVLANAVRAATTAVDRGLAGPINEASAFLFKSPPVGMSESAGLHSFRSFAE